MFRWLIYRELRTAWREPQAIFQPIIFFAITISLFPIALGADSNTLQNSAPAALWLALLLASMLAASSLFAEDFADGTLSQDVIHLSDLWLAIIAKVCAAWLTFLLPLLILLPLFCLMLHIPMTALPAVALETALGSFALLMIGTLGAVLTLNKGKSTFLQFLIVVPLYFPILILGTTATAHLLHGFSISGELALLAAFSLFALISIVPFATLALRYQPLP